MKKLIILLCTFSTICLLQAQIPERDVRYLVQSGPMLGYSEMKEVAIWIQTNESASVYALYWEKNAGGVMFRTAVVETEKKKGFTAHLIADELMPGLTYEYKIYVNKEEVEFAFPLEFQTSPNWKYREEPPAFSIALGSCLYINELAVDRKGSPYGGEYEIVKSIYDKNPDLMLWLGDNTYFRPVDWNTRTGMIHRHTHTRSLPELQPLLASTHHYAIWDDHDYGPNDHNRSFIHKETALETFKMFWANPVYGFMGNDCAVSSFSWGDADFFLLDNRWFRAANGLESGGKDYFGKAQIDWLIESLKASRAPFKIIASGGQILNPAKVYENYSNYEEERAYFLKRLEEEDIWGVFFLSGDRHHSELTKMDRVRNYPLYDLTVSPLTSGVHGDESEPNYFRVEKTMVTKRNFAILSFSGALKERVMTITIYNAQGKKEWEREISASDLRPERK